MSSPTYCPQSSRKLIEQRDQAFIILIRHSARFYAVVPVAASEQTVVASGPCAGQVPRSFSRERSPLVFSALRCLTLLPRCPPSFLPPPNRPAASAWPRANSRICARFPSRPAALWLMRPARTRHGPRFQKEATPLAASTRNRRIGKPKLPAPAGAAPRHNVRSSSSSGSTATPTDSFVHTLAALTPPNLDGSCPW